MPNKKTILKIISYLFILGIFFFFGKNLVDNWQKIKDYHFSLNYFYLVLAMLCFAATIIAYSIIWNVLLKILEPEKRLSGFKALNIFINSWFGRYLPGKFWMFVGRIYLGVKEGIPKRALAVSSLLEIVLSITAAFLWGLLLLTIAFGAKFSHLYFFPVIIMLGGLVFTHPRIFYPLCNFALRRVKREEIPAETFLKYRDIWRFIGYYFIALSFDGIGFYILINAIAHLSLRDIIGVMGAYNLSAVLGTVVIFAPGGLGIKEGILVMIMQFYFPLNIAILISIISRIVLSAAEAGLFGVVYMWDRIIKKSKIKYQKSK